MDDVEAKEILSSGALAVRSRVRQALQRAGLSQSEASRRAQASCPKAVRQLLSNAYIKGAKPRDPEVQRAFAEALGADPLWLWFGSTANLERGRIWSSSDGEETDVEGVLEPERSSDVPASSPSGFPMRPDPAAYAVPVATDTWEPLVRRGDCVLVTPSYPPTIGALVYVRTSAGDGIYRLAAMSDDGVVLIGPTGMPASKSASSATIHRVGGIVCG